MAKKATIAGALVVLLGGGCASSNSPCEYPLDSRLNLSDLQMKGTHNSYHLRPDSVGVAEWDYSQAPLDVQLADQGVRQFELDVYSQADGGFRVQHAPDLDPKSNCSPLGQCLGLLKDWSDANPRHLPIFVMIDIKDFFDEIGEPEDYFQAIEGRILSVWQADRLILPDIVLGDRASLREAVMGGDWPTLGDSRGKALFVLFEGGEFRSAYTHGDKDAADRLMFPRAGDTEVPYAAVLMFDDPIANQGGIRQAVAEGFLVRTRADSGTVEARAEDYTRLDAALSSGAQFVSTDFPAPGGGFDYWVDIPDGTPARCNPVHAPPECDSHLLEGAACQ